MNLAKPNVVSVYNHPQRPDLGKEGKALAYTIRVYASYSSVKGRRDETINT